MDIICITDAINTGNCYIINLDNASIIIDPCVNLDLIQYKIGNRNVPYLFLTHGHADHISHLDEIKSFYSSKIVCTKETKEMIEDVNLNFGNSLRTPIELKYDNTDYLFVENEELIIDGTKLSIIRTPGHTSGSISIIIGNYIFTGDALFKNAFGRYDLPTGSSKQTRDTLRLFATLNKDLIVKPGHGEDTILNDEIIRYIK